MKNRNVRRCKVHYLRCVWIRKWSSWVQTFQSRVIQPI